MNPDEIALLREALDLPEPQRADFIEARCAGDPAQARRLRNLLAMDEEPDALLDGGVDGLLIDALIEPGGEAEFSSAPLADRSGEEIGPWRILRHLAEGGMGSVWLAERADGAFAQTVALKTVKPGMDSAAVLRAFQREREVLARLQHPQIAHLIDGGVDASVRPWFAMRHVEGEPLDRWLQRAPPLRQRLTLFASLCRVVAHAHRQLVVHQDIKPGNILVQAEGTPCLLDFGIGRILHGEAADATQTVQRFASPAYAAPEQIAGGAISTATDVYALGAILFELLTGQRYSAVHRGADATTRPSHAAASHVAPASVALPAAQLVGDLDAIAARALAHDPARRYGSADLLADDVDRYLAGWPVTARPDGELYRLSKWIRRNRVASAALLAAALALAAGLGASLWQTRLARQEAQRATAIKDYLVSLFDAGRTNAQGVEVLDQRVIDLLDASSSRLKDELAGLPEVRDEIYTTLVEIHDANGRPERSVALARERVAQAEQAFGANDPRLAPALVMLAGVSLNHDDLEAIPPLLDRAQALLDAAGARSSLSQALIWQYRGALAGRLGKMQEATALLERAVALLRARFPDTDDYITALFMQIQSIPARQEPERAHALIGEMRTAVRARHGTEHFLGVQADLMEALWLLLQAHHSEALALLRDTAPRLEHFVGPGHPDVFVLRHWEIEALLALGRIDEALALWQRTDAHRQAQVPESTELAEGFRALRAQIDAAARTGASTHAASQ